MDNNIYLRWSVEELVSLYYVTAAETEQLSVF